MVVAYVPDLMDRSRVEIAAQSAGLTVDFVPDPEDLVVAVRAGARFVLVDLAHTVGFASHVDKPLLEAAKAAGCDEVLPRSAVFRRLARIETRPTKPAPPIAG
jgi:hypothetical protein